MGGGAVERGYSLLALMPAGFLLLHTHTLCTLSLSLHIDPGKRWWKRAMAVRYIHACLYDRVIMWDAKYIQLLTMDLLALATMKNAVKCEK